MSGKKICFFVHECVLEVGHTRAMLEVLNSMPESALDEIHLVYFEGQSSEKLFPRFKGKVIHHKVPGHFLFPFLIKAIAYQIWCFFFVRFILNKDVLKIGIGTACLNVDICNIQFIQSQWRPLFFRSKSIFSLSYYYKKILFTYFSFCENLLFRDDKVKFMSLSKFITKYLIDRFQINPAHIKTEYSSVNLEGFPLPSKEKSIILDELSVNYKTLESLDLERPIFLFIGAFERKGLNYALEKISTVKDSQIIVIGKSEFSGNKSIKKGVEVIHIPFTKEVDKFYQLSDYFIFPTIYEPFGLVITEAAAMGNIVLTFKENVGASEILEGLPSVIFIDQEKYNFLKIAPLTLSQRIQNAKMVRARLADYSWSKPAKALNQIINSF